VVLDPVLASGRGDQFADEEMIEAMIGLLLPQTTLLTPNSLEARRLAQQLGEAMATPATSAACRMRACPDQCRMRICAGHGNP
jgi:hydroxymethylpyrimidine/phosphomethylpyrimidine kinase